MACTPLYTFSPTPTSTAGSPTVAVPSGITNGQTITLSGGTNYSGTIVIASLTGVTLNVSCSAAAGPATISPAAGQNAISANSSLSCSIDGSGIGGSAAGIVIRAANVGVSGNNTSGITVTRIAAIGCSSAGIEVSGTTNATVNRCYIESCSAGVAAIGGGVTNNSLITENTIKNVNSIAAFAARGIYIEAGSSNEISSNRVISCTYHGIAYLKAFNGRINCNSIDFAPMGADADSGAIYTQHISSTAIAVNAIISSNLVTNVLQGGKGIYLDDQARGFTIQRNTVLSCDWAIELHRATDVNIISNSCVDYSTVGVHFSGATGELHSISVTDNVLRTTFTPGETFNFESGADFKTWAIIDRNFYFNSNLAQFAHVFTSGAANDYTFANFRSLYAQDANSTFNVTVGSMTVADIGSGSTSSSPVTSMRLHKRHKRY